MRSKRAKSFHKLFDRLPKDIQDQAIASYKLFHREPYHPSLHFKCIDKEASIYSTRVGRSYRAVAVWEGDTIIWFWIGSHEDYNHFF